MPELPEVETIKNALIPELVGQKILSVTLSGKKLRRPVQNNLEKLMRGQKIENIERRAKYIHIFLKGGDALLIHLGMSGNLFVKNKKNYQPQPHDHVVVGLHSTKILIFNDPRRFGFFEFCNSKTLKNHTFLKNLGMEPFDKGLNPQWLLEKFKNKKQSIKATIMDQKIIVGVGNIYASEALYLARIHPTRFAQDLNLKELGILIKAIQATLKKAISAGGSSISDFKNIKGEAGYFQHQFKVYDRQGEICSRRHRKTPITKITQNNRATYFCPTCQG